LGNVILIHARKDLKKGDEVTLAYISMRNSYSERTKKIFTSWGFTCQCRLCKLDAKDDNCGKRAKIFAQFEKMCDDNVLTPKLAGPILEQVSLSY
jgi:hypothetical protein